MRFPILFRVFFVDTVNRLLEERRGDQVVLAQERAARIELERRCAAQQTTIDWLTAELTQTRLERAAMMERAFQISIPVPTISVLPGTSTPPQPERIAQESFAHMVGSMPMPKNVPAAEGAVSKLAESMGISFEDPGDTEASTLGYAPGGEGVGV